MPHCRSLVFASLLLLISTGARGQDSASQQEAARHAQAAQNFIQQKRPDLAVPELKKLVSLDPGNVDAHGNLGVLLYFSGDYTGAIPELRKATQLQPDLWKIQALLGLAEARLKDDAASRDDLAAAFPHLQEAKLKVDVGSALISNYTDTGDVEKAAGVVSTLLEEQPTNPALIFSAYQLYAQLADKATISLALVAPGSAQMRLLMARELKKHGDDAMAIANYREALKLDPHLGSAHYELGIILYNSDDEKNKAEAAEQFKAALVQDPADEKANLMLGVIAAKQSDWPTATDYEQKALALQPDDPDANLELAKAYIATKQREKAQKLIEHAIEIDPTDYIAHYRLGSIYRSEGRTADAEKQLAEYRKYKDMKDKLQAIFHDMRVKTAAGTQSEDDAQK